MPSNRASSRSRSSAPASKNKTAKSSGSWQKTSSPADNRISDELAQRIGRHKFDMWFGRSARLRVNGQKLEIATDSQFVKEWIDSHFAQDLRSVATEFIGSRASVAFHVAPDLFDRDPTQATAAVAATNGKPKPGSKRGRSGRGAANRRTTRIKLRQLDDLVVGPSNKLAHSAARRLAEDPEAGAISPLFIHGDCGLGKTHLLQAVCAHAAAVSGREAAVRYVTGEQFTNEYIAAVRNQNVDAFRRRFRRLDVLAIDDVHFLSNKVATQSEFLHTLDAIDMSGARVALASDEHPRQIKRFSQALVSRFLSGMVVKIDPPSHEMRTELIRRTAMNHDLRINDTAIDMMARGVVGSVRELEGGITKLAALKRLTDTGDPNGEVGAVLVRRLLNDTTLKPRIPVRIATILEVVCTRLSVDRAELMGSGRHRRVVLARGLVAHLARSLTTLSYPEIAHALGRTYHSTVHTAAQRVRRRLDDPAPLHLGEDDRGLTLRELVDQLQHEILRAASRG